MLNLDFYSGSNNYCRLSGNGGATSNLNITCGGVPDVTAYAEGWTFRVTPSMAALTVKGGKVALDANGTVWVQETGGKVVIGTGRTNLFSINTSTGNVVTKGTVTQGNP